MSRSDVVHGCRYTGIVSAMRAAIKVPLGFHSMTDDAAFALSANGRKGMDRAFEAIEIMRFAFYNHFKTVVVFVAADFAGICHDEILSS